jgi:hypothetical protein
LEHLNVDTSLGSRPGDLLCLLHSVAVLQVNEEQRGDITTFSGYLCSLAGEIPAVSDRIIVPGYIFTIVQVTFLHFHDCVGSGCDSQRVGAFSC